MAFAASINLAALDATTGFRISGEAAGDWSGFSVASAGDVNGDGIDDLIIGASRADANGTDSGASYVVFGSAAGFPTNLDLSTLNGTNGFRISGAAGDFSGVSVASAGDVNGDGIDDLIIGATGADPNSLSSSGASYVVFGRDTAIDGAFAANMNLAALDGTNGFRISGVAALDLSGGSVASVGDINGDGIGDLIVGARYADTPGGNGAGASYVVFGRDTAVVGTFAANLDLSALDGTDGFRIVGEAAFDLSGGSVASAGDVNGDGLDDLIIGASGADAGGYSSGASYVVFGSALGFAATFNLFALNGTNGFRISGVGIYDTSGCSVASAGDVNGDGVDDLIIGAKYADPNGDSSGASYVVFGRDTAITGAFAANLSLGALDGTNGFRISGAAAGDDSGSSVAAAGDVNGDGIGDLIIGAPGADPNGSSSGASYVVFGSAAGFAANLDLSALDGTDGFRINGVSATDGSGYSVAAAGDVNGDGFDDLIIGARYADPGGAVTGASYVIYGRLDFTGSPGNDTRIGGASNDSLSGGDGNDVLSGLAGDDLLDGGDMSDTLYGGAGADALLGGLGNDHLYGDDGIDELSGGDGADKLYGGLGADQLNGGAGADTLDGGLGADVMSGGLANDIYIVDDLGDQTNENVGEGTDVVHTAIDGWVLSANVERLELKGSGDISGTGNSLANTLLGNSGNNTLNGGAGNDTLDGGLGADVMSGGTESDTYVVDDLGDQTIENAAAGFDTVHTAIDGWVLSANVEVLQLLGLANLSGTGNSLANNLYGNSGANTLYGLAGADVIQGNNGDDIIVGGLGNDVMGGGAGADTFVVGHAFAAGLETDTISDFSTAGGDILDLSGAYGGTLAIVSAFTNTAGQMTLAYASGQTTVRLDIDGNGVAEYQLKINGDVTGQTAGWLL